MPRNHRAVRKASGGRYDERPPSMSDLDTGRAHRPGTYDWSQAFGPPDGRGFIIPKLTRKDQPKAACNVRSRKGRPHRITESQYHCQSREDRTCAIFCLALRVVRFSPPAIVRDKRVWVYGRSPLEITHDSIPCGNTKNENAWFQLAENRKIRLE